MSAWLAATTALIVGLAPLLVVCVRADPMSALVALQMGGVINILAMVTLAIGLNRPLFLDLALILGLLSWSGGLVYVRFMERWV